MKGKTKLDWLRGNAAITRTFHLYYRNFKGISMLTKRWEISKFAIVNSKLTINSQEEINLEHYRIGPLQPFIQSGSGIIQILQRSTSMMGGMRSKSVGERSKTWRDRKNERVQFTLTNLKDKHIKIGISGTESDGIYVFRKLLIANRVAGKVLTEVVDSAELVVGNLIGVGGAARIFEGTYFGMPVAIKRFHEINRNNEKEVEMSLEKQVAEILNLKELRHSNVVSVLGVFLEKSILSVSTLDVLNDRILSYFSPFLLSLLNHLLIHSLPQVLMERCYGSLHEALHDTRQTPQGEIWNVKHFCVVVEGIANAMAYIHRHNVIHRDLKPANILLTQDFQPKITDFGDSRKRATRMSINIGTPIYQAPEQIATDRSLYKENKKIEYDKSIDMYAFAIILWELWTGDVPYSDMSTISSIENHVKRGGRPSLVDDCDKKKFVKWSRELKMLIRACWSQKSNRRPTFDLFKKQWSVQFSDVRVQNMINDQSARPWFTFPNYVEEGEKRRKAFRSLREHEKKRMSKMNSNELHFFMKEESNKSKNPDLSKLSDLVLKQDIEGSELLSFDKNDLTNLGIERKRRSQILNTLRNLRDNCSSSRKLMRNSLFYDFDKRSKRRSDNNHEKNKELKFEDDVPTLNPTLRRLKIRELNSQQLGSRLRSMGLKRLGNILEKEGCTGNNFADFKEDDIDFFNISSNQYERIISGEDLHDI